MEDLLDLTEYVQSPLENVGGMFGTFSAKTNDDFDPKERGSRKYVRHKAIKRSSVVDANVQTWIDRERILRVALPSLRSLARLFPGEYALPARIPQTHSEHGRRTAAPADAPADAPANAPAPADAPAAQPAPVQAKTRVAVYWEEEPVGWFKGTATSHRKHDGADGSVPRWQTRVAYDNTPGYRKHSRWHFLDGGEESVKWRTCDSSDEED